MIYELPTAWTRAGDLVDAKNVGVRTFRDVRALVDRNFAGGNFATMAAVAGAQHLIDLGANALELLPPADTYLDRRSWGYGTSNYGTTGNFYPARRHMIAHLLHWLGFFHVDGLRLDSVNVTV
ncbi:MAG TPA: hypothetical protein VHO67_23405 [Polyangia bacterium]|nr:hypothetical protein [Polyangia bacterium]